MRGCFVTGTDTGVGKTVLAAAIVASLRARGVAVGAVKPVITGLDEPADPNWPPDHELLARVAGVAPDAVNAFGYGPPVSPHLAAALAGQRVKVDRLLAAVQAAASTAEVLVVEGVGGLMVPLTETHDVRGFAREVGLPIVIAARAGLGTINHTLLTLEAARAAGLELLGVVMTPWPAEPELIERSNRETIERLGGVQVATLPWIARADPELLAAAAQSLPLQDWLGWCAVEHQVLTATRASVLPMRTTADLAAADGRYLWHPFTQQQGWCEEEPPVVVDQAEGTNLYDTDGKVYIDGVSSLWCNVHGHRHPAIDAAVRAQLERVAHSTMLGLSHQPAIELAEQLVAVSPGGLTRVFYSDSGSTAVEIALKMAFQWWVQRGEGRRPRFIFLENAYHGDTIGAVSVGGIDLFHSLYRPLLFNSWRTRPGDAAHLEQLLAQHGQEVAAVIVEPLVQGAAGMLMAPNGYLRRVREACDAHGVLLICDEVATGLGRTGRMFACEHEDVAPDLLCLGKGLTGGYLPLAATVTTDGVYEGFLGRFEDFRTFFHGHTYTGNPLACAAGVATLETFERERTLERLQPKIELLTRLLDHRVASLPGVVEVRQRGFMVGIELIEAPPRARLGHQVASAARKRGAIIRPLGDVVVLMPPLSISEADLGRLVAITASAIADATSGRLQAAA